METQSFVIGGETRQSRLVVKEEWMKTKNFQWFLTILVVLAFSFTARQSLWELSPAAMAFD
jgi:hypothetical protein